MLRHPAHTAARQANGSTGDTPVMFCFGTRPEVIKLAPVIAQVTRHPTLRPIVVATAQHRQMLDQMLRTFGIEPDLDLDLMEPGQPLHALAGRAVTALGMAIRQHRPAAVVLQGDTTTALCAALAASYCSVPVAHVEAGLRTGNRMSPFPEELNRRMIGGLADWHFCPTSHSAQNLLDEGIDPEGVFITGNPVVDALHWVAKEGPAPEQAGVIPPRSAERRLLVTMHRRETQGPVQRELLRMLARLADRADVEIVLPVHLSPAVRENVMRELGGRHNVHLTDPLEYASFVQLMQTADLILTDSGGLQEEAPALGIPLLVMRDTTERPEGIEAGCVRLCGIDPVDVERHLCEVLADAEIARAMSEAPNPYGDGHAAERIVSTMASRLAGETPELATAPPTFPLQTTIEESVR